MSPKNCFDCWTATPRRVSAAVVLLEEDFLCLGCARDRGYSESEIADGMIAKINAASAAPVPAKDVVSAILHRAVSITDQAMAETETPKPETKAAQRETKSAKPETKSVSVDVNTREEEMTMPRTTPESSVQPGQQKCRHPKCEKLTRSAVGCCSDHWWWGTHGAGRLDQVTGNPALSAETRRPQPAPEKPAPKAMAAAAGAGTVNVTVPVASLDNWWERRDAETKARAFADWLQRGAE